MVVTGINKFVSYLAELSSRSLCLFSRHWVMVDLRYVFTLLRALNDLSLVALDAGITRINFINVMTLV